MCEILHKEGGEDLKVGKEGKRREEEKKGWKDGGKERKTSIPVVSFFFNFLFNFYFL